MRKEYITIPSSDNINTLNVKIYIPNGEPIGIFQAVHGMTEHLERYDELLEAVCEAGYFCIIHDHLGHGKTAKKEDLGFIAKKDGYKLLVDDVERVYRAADMRYPNKKHVLLGHSMGSFITRLYVKEYGKHLSSYIMMGSGNANPASDIGILLTRLICKIKGDRHVSRFIYSMAFGSYNKKFKDENNIYAWLSCENTNKEIYAKDEYCTFKFCVSAMNDLIRLNKNCNKKEWYKSLPENLKIFILSGEDDPVGEHGKGITRVYEKLKREEKYDVTLKLYKESRHEILKDFCKNEVISDIISFI